MNFRARDFNSFSGPLLGFAVALGSQAGSAPLEAAQAEADVRIAISAEVAGAPLGESRVLRAMRGDSVAYRVMVRNDGPSQATGLELAAFLPQGMEITGVAFARGSCGIEATQVSCSAASLAMGATVHPSNLSSVSPELSDAFVGLGLYNPLLEENTFNLQGFSENGAAVFDIDQGEPVLLAVKQAL